MWGWEGPGLNMKRLRRRTLVLGDRGVEYVGVRCRINWDVLQPSCRGSAERVSSMLRQRGGGGILV